MKINIILAFFKNLLLYPFKSDSDAVTTDYSKKVTILKNSDSKSIANKNRSTKLSDQEILYLGEKAESCINSSNFREALLIYNQLIESAVPHPHYYKRRAWIYRMLSDFNAAIRDMDKAIQMNADDAVSYWERGACYAHKLSLVSDIDKGIKIDLLRQVLSDYKASVERDPSSSEAWLAILETEMLLHDWDDAISNYGICKPYVDSREYLLVRSWLGCLALIFADEIIEDDDAKSLNDSTIRLKRNSWCVSEIDSLLFELETDNFSTDKLKKANEIHDKFLGHFDETPMRL